MNDKEAVPNISGAHIMLGIFASVGATAFDVTMLDIEGREQGFQKNRTVDELKRTMDRRMQTATALKQSIVIRPRSTTALLVQLDDFSPERAWRIEPYAFMTLNTSPGNCQVWLAVSDGPQESDKEAAKQFRTRLRRGAGADHSATGATRIAGGFNFKTKYAPDFPLVTLGQVKEGQTVTVAQLEKAGLIAQAESPQPPASSAPVKFPVRPTAGRQWPDYQDVLANGQRRADGKPDRSKADFFWCKYAIERGWSVDEVASRLAEVSERARERIKLKGDVRYCQIVAENAEKSEQERRSRRQFLKPAARPSR